MVRSKTKSRKVASISPTSAVPVKATSLATRKTGLDRPKHLVVQMNSRSSPAKVVRGQRDKKASLKSTIPRPPPIRSPFFQRRKPPLPEEDQDMFHMRDAMKLAREHVGHKPAAYDQTMNLIRTDGGFAVFFNAMFEASKSLRCPKVRPILIQECMKDNPFLMVVAVIFLNKTTGTKAIPKFYEVIERWNTPAAFAQANRKRLFRIIKPLGFGDKRTDALINLGKMWLKYPPVTPQSLQDNPEEARVQRTINARMARKKNPGLFKRFSDENMPAIAHLPWVGQYAVDSYTIYCCGDDDWMSVRPEDKELLRYVMWRWALLGKGYDMEENAPVGYATPDYIAALVRELVEFSPYKTLDKLADEERALGRASARTA